MTLELLRQVSEEDVEVSADWYNAVRTLQESIRQERTPTRGGIVVATSTGLKFIRLEQETILVKSEGVIQQLEAPDDFSVLQIIGDSVQWVSRARLIVSRIQHEHLPFKPIATGVRGYTG